MRLWKATGKDGKVSVFLSDNLKLRLLVGAREETRDHSEGWDRVWNFGLPALCLAGDCRKQRVPVIALYHLQGHAGCVKALNFSQHAKA